MSNEKDAQPTTDLREALANASQKLAQALDDLQAVSVETRGVEVKQGQLDNKIGRLLASTEIDFDGDTALFIPLKDENGTLVVDQALLDIHQASVQNAINYRKELLTMIIDFVRPAVR